MRLLAVFFFFPLFSHLPANGDLCDRKSLMGSPDEFDRYLSPSPYDSATASRSLMLQQIDLEPGQTYASSFHVDTANYFTLALMSSTDDILNQFKLAIKDPDGRDVSPSITTNEEVSLDGFVVPTTTFAVTNPEVGTWKVEVTRAGDTKTQDVIRAFVLVGIPDSVFMVTTLDSYDLLVGEKVTIKTLPVDTKGLQNRKDGHLAVKTSSADFSQASMILYKPDGEMVRMNLQKEIDGDNSTSDSGIFEGTFVAESAGAYRAIVYATGDVDNERKELDFGRTTWLLFNVIEKTLELTGKANINALVLESNCLDRMHIDINIGVKAEQPFEKYRAYAQVWGKSLLDGKDVPIGWVSGMTLPSSSQTITMRINLSYIVKAVARSPFSLRELRIEDSSYFITVASADVIEVDIDESQAEMLAKIVQKKDEFVLECGKEPRKLSNESREGGKLILVHGYCSTAAGTFPLDQFTDSARFEDFQQSRTHDKFAELICDFGRQFPSYGLLGHSHGGIASLHLYTYYESGVDYAEGGRLVQSVGSPYGGSPLSALLALIGELLGIGCGTNNDLTYAAMDRWISLLPEENARELYYYSTQYATGGLINYCLLPSNLILSWPNDGVVEESRSDLPYANHVSHNKGECHTAGMQWPAQTQNQERNAEMNSLAAR